MTAQIVPFSFNGAEVRTVLIDGEPWWVIADVAAALTLTNPSVVASQLDPDDLSSTEVIDSLGRQQRARTVNESGLYGLIFQSRKLEAKVFKRWITHEVLPSIRKTGTYSTAPAAPRTELEIIREQHAAISTLLEHNEQITARAVVAEEFKAAIEVADGLTPREFHKHYLSDIGERVFFQILYTANLLIDQRAMRTDANGKPKAGKQHGHPSYKGKPYFYLHPTVDRDGNRFENTRVRPGDAELALLAFFTKRGHTSTHAPSKELANV